MSDYYSYIFVRQDLSPEQQLIQFGHAACLMGSRLPSHIKAETLNFVGIGVRNSYELFVAKSLMEDNGVVPWEFHETDLPEDQLTAIASSPVVGDVRSIFRSYDTLRFGTI